MDIDLRGRTALVSGASTGIGAGVALALAREGVHLALTARRKDKLEDLARLLKDVSDAEPLLLPADLTDKEALEKVAEHARGALGPIDILANCAGGSRPIGTDRAEDVWNEALALNFHAARRLSEALLPDMKEKRWGRIINISGSMEPRASNAATPAKAALHLWAKGLSCDVARYGITVNCIAPGRIKSEQTMTRLHPTEAARDAFIKANIPIGYFGEPEDIANMAVYLASPLSRYVTGAVIPVDGGMHYFAH
ncbi:SDR family NAD(P)-dependent oxidoreductase [Xanthobacter autotrophicus]|uniref:SDR family NAD(P)-dependent oxidoreductase n=1 Tax=Xanthobacter autotrophicus TaxID=280 RepID=UPI00372A5802